MILNNSCVKLLLFFIFNFRATIHVIKNFYECEVLIEKKSVPRVTVWHHQALLSGDKLYPRDRFFNQYLTLMIDSFSCTFLGCQHRIRIKFTSKYSAFASAILILTSFFYVLSRHA